jgi:hypothetical protein
MGTATGSWNFTVNADGWWTWSHDDGQGNRLAQSRQPFRYFHQCLEDAKKHGYAGHRPGNTFEFRCFF